MITIQTRNMKMLKSGQVGGQHIVVFCTTLHAANTTDAQKDEEVRRAGQEFGAMLQRMSIRSR